MEEEALAPGAALAAWWGIDTDQARVLAEVLQGGAASRQELVARLGVRSTTVSELVGRLLQHDLLVETVQRRPARGRPSMSLVGNPHRVVVLVFHVLSQSLQVSSVNLLGQVTGRVACEIPPECDNRGMALRINRLRVQMLQGLSAGTQVAGAAFSLPGLIDAGQARWIFSSRWPRLRNLDLGRVLQDWDAPVVATRNLDAELRMRLATGGRKDARTLLLHWGYGIGTTFAANGTPVLGGAGGFGEIGHWAVPQAGAPCLCGRQGCLETVAALWSIGPKLLGERFSAAADEREVAEQLADLDLSDSAIAAKALESLATAVGNLCLVLFPARIVVTGPFVANRALWVAFRERLERAGIFRGLPMPELECGQRSQHLELLGAAGPLMRLGLERLWA